MDKHLEPCAHCGSPALLYREMTLIKIICLNALCTAHETLGFSTAEAAIEAWNRRLDTTNLMQALEANNELSRLVTKLEIEDARLRVALGVTQPPPAVAPYHRLD